MKALHFTLGGVLPQNDTQDWMLVLLVKGGWTEYKCRGAKNRGVFLLKIISWEICFSLNKFSLKSWIFLFFPPPVWDEATSAKGGYFPPTLFLLISTRGDNLGGHWIYTSFISSAGATIKGADCKPLLLGSWIALELKTVRICSRNLKEESSFPQRLKTKSDEK